MDWSLVLASQGIEAIIEHWPESEGWVLLVEPGEYERSLEAIARYLHENRGWDWRRRLVRAGHLFHWGVLGWCAVLGLFHFFAYFLGKRFEAAGILDSVAVRQGQWWRLFTAISLHADVGHLAANVSTGFLLLGLAMARYGPGVALLSSFLAGAAGNVLGLLVYSHPYRGLGASGMVMGALGLVVIQSISLWRLSRRATPAVLTSLIAGCFLFLWWGVNPASDVIAHLGGFVAGLFLGAALAWVPEGRIRRPGLNQVCLLATTSWFCLCWWLALRSPHS